MSDNEKKEVLWKILFGKQSKFSKHETKQKKTNQANNQNNQDTTDDDDDVYHKVLIEEVDDIEDDIEDNSSSSEDEDDDYFYLRKAFNSIFSFISIEEFFSKNEEELGFCDRFFDIFTLKIQNRIEEIRDLKSKLKLHLLYIITKYYLLL